MRRIWAWFSRFGGAFGKERRERELSAEMESHLQMHIEDNLRAGMTQEQARREALLKLGGVEQTKENYRERRGLPFFETSLRDLHFAARVLRKNPGFTCIVVLTLTLGIGANTAIFSVLESQLWRPLPFPDSERLADVHVVLRDNPRQWDVLTPSIYLAWIKQSRVFSQLGAYNYPGARNLTAGGVSERVLVMPLTSSTFKTLDVPLERGRIFLPEENTAGRDRVAILSHVLWQTRFSSASDIIGKPITLDGDTYIVIGIASSRLRFEYLTEPAIYVPLALDPAAKLGRGLYAIGRLSPGATPESARVELDAILQRQLQSEGAKQEDVAGVTNLREAWTNYAARQMYFFAGAILLVLLIACVNNAGLLLARGLARQREFALRATLGASRAALIRQSLAESLLLCIAGGGAGAFLGVWSSGLFAAFWNEDTLPRHTSISLDTRVLLFVLCASIFSSLLMGILPALFSSRVDVNETLRKSAGGLSAGRGQHRTRGVLVGPSKFLSRSFCSLARDFFSPASSVKSRRREDSTLPARSLFAFPCAAKSIRNPTSSAATSAIWAIKSEDSPACTTTPLEAVFHWLVRILWILSRWLGARSPTSTAPEWSSIASIPITFRCSTCTCSPAARLTTPTRPGRPASPC